MKSRDGVANIYKTQRGYWRVRFYSEGGKICNKVCRTITERDALCRAIKRREDLDYWFPNVTHIDVIHELGSFKVLADKWLDHSGIFQDSCRIELRSQSIT